MADRVLILGGGLAGLGGGRPRSPGRARASTLLESRNRLGGRAGSFTDAATGQILDACQHVSMGCCTNFAHFCRTVGVAHLLQPQPDLYFMTPDRRVSPLRRRPPARPVPPGPHLPRRPLPRPDDKPRVAWGLARLQRTAARRRPALRSTGSARHGQTPRTIDRFWGVVLTSALNETADRVGLRYARKVFVDGFLRHRRGFEVELPSRPARPALRRRTARLARPPRRPRPARPGRARASTSAATAFRAWSCATASALDGRLVRRRRAVRPPARPAAGRR